MAESPDVLLLALKISDSNLHQEFDVIGVLYPDFTTLPDPHETFEDNGHHKTSLAAFRYRSLNCSKSSPVEKP